jgi:DNA-binding protein WhiA
VQLGVLGEGGLERGIVPSIVRKRCCRAAYLRGLFLGSGYISDPRGDFHFEITVETKTFADAIVELLAESGIQAKVMARRNTHIVYLKSGSAISDFLALVGAHHNALQMETERVRKSVRNDVNRQVNAEIANQAKTAAASVEQVMVIRKVLDHQDIHSLPVGLQEYIRLRVRHPDATLKELGALADPPLSKSAIYHRVRRLQEIADSID